MVFPQDSTELLPRLERLRPLPSLAIRILNRGSSLAAPDDGSLLREVEVEDWLGTEALRLVNGGVTDQKSVHATLAVAVSNLGADSVLYAAFQALFVRHLLGASASTRVGATLWVHSQVVGALARELAETRAAPPFPTAMLGLLHDLGRLAMCRLAPDSAEKVQELIDGGMPLAEAEKRIFGVRASFLTVVAARSLNLPAHLSALLLSLDSVDVTPPLPVTLVTAADHLASLLGYPVCEGALGTPLDPELESSLGLQASNLHHLAGVAAMAARTSHSRTHLALGEQAAHHDAAFHALLQANRRLVRLNAGFERSRRELSLRATDTHELLAAFGSLKRGHDADSLRFRILESLHEHYGVASTILVEGEEGHVSMSGYSFRLDSRLGPEFLNLRLDLGDIEPRRREELASGRTVRLHGDHLSKDLWRRLGQHPSYWLAPLRVRGQITGLLGLGCADLSTGYVGEGEYLGILAAAAALGLENARLYNDVLQAASSDPLTAVATRRVVMAELERLARRPLVERSPFAVLLIDLDHFKAVNDTLGHQAGDRYLREMVGALQEGLTEEDLLGRYGGDEFLVILRNVDLGEAQQRAEEMVGLVRAKARSARWAIVPARLGATIGLAWWDGDAIDAASLTSLADSSLYTGKAAGRDRVGAPAIREPAVFGS